MQYEHSPGMRRLLFNIGDYHPLMQNCWMKDLTQFKLINNSNNSWYQQQWLIIVEKFLPFLIVHIIQHIESDDISSNTASNTWQSPLPLRFYSRKLLIKLNFRNCYSLLSLGSSLDHLVIIHQTLSFIILIFIHRLSLLVLRTVNVETGSK